MEKYLKNRNVEKTFNKVMQLDKIHIEEISNNLKKGIYFLWLNNAIVYIGMSEKSMTNRIFGNGGWDGHIQENTKAFNYYSYYNVSNVDDIRELEIFLINIFNPYYNVVSKNFNYEDKLDKNYMLIRNDVNTRINKFETDRMLLAFEKNIF
jgi:hypothetical protein